ncbi:hypothetical protein Ahy_A03g015870 isoform C [Arachis hypogaea]|uniref:Uncharacterized protein n=1 Tax=Arachis hypogaea TaxID=3818 RepID=A0A445E1I1_ARAHY|nr:hypothetical protein Ahy_A03g015870 isoform C [Arachis hypogaea]
MWRQCFQCIKISPLRLTEMSPRRKYLLKLTVHLRVFWNKGRLHQDLWPLRLASFDILIYPDVLLLIN